MKQERIYETPFYKLNHLLRGGFRPGTLVVVGGLPWMGKTSFLISLMLDLQTNSEVKGLFITLNEKIQRLLEKVVAQEARISIQKILTGDMSGEEHHRFVESTSRFFKKGLTTFISERDQIWENIEEAIGNDAKVIFIDTLQRMITTQDTYQEMSLIVNKLREIAIKNDVCIIVSSGLNRKVYERTGHRPMINDLRDSGYIEECADQIIFINRREMFDPHDKPGQCEVFLEKNRFGSTGEFSLAFINDFGQFINLG